MAAMKERAKTAVVVAHTPVSESGKGGATPPVPNCTSDSTPDILSRLPLELQSFSGDADDRRAVMTFRKARADAIKLITEEVSIPVSL